MTNLSPERVADNSKLGAHPASQDRAGGLRPEPRSASQPKALVTLRGALPSLPELIAIACILLIWAVWMGATLKLEQSI